MALVESKLVTTLPGGVTGRGFMPGQSGNPGGRPRGLARRVRQLVGESGEAIVEFMVTVMDDPSARRADRIEAAKWLADRGFGRAIQGLEIDVAEGPSLDLRMFSDEDLDALLAILDRYVPDVAEIAASSEIPIQRNPLGATQYRRR